MPLHLIKLAVGCDSVKELKEWIAERMQTAKKKGLPQHHIHITRMVPKRDTEITFGCITMRQRPMPSLSRNGSMPMIFSRAAISPLITQ